MGSIQPLASSRRQGVAEPTSVYRYYDPAGLLIYVGITSQGIGRNLQHNGKAEWWQYVGRQEVEHYPDRVSAAAREVQLIRQYRPPFNKQHNRDQVQARAAYLAYAATVDPNATAESLYSDLGKQMPLTIVDYDGTWLVLRSLLPHGPLANALVLPKGTPTAPVYGKRRKYGYAFRLESHGAVATITCRIRSRLAPADGFTEATALLAWMSPKPHYPWIRQIQITEADYVPKPKRVDA